MILSNTSRYGIRAVIYLVVNTRLNTKIGIKKIASDLNIPTPFLGKILQMLVKKGVLDSIKGPNGGFGMNQQTPKVSLMELVEIIDGANVFKGCVIGVRDCDNPDEPQCAIHDEFSSLRDKLIKLFKDTTVDHLAKNYATSSKKIGL